jgi:hypothetical protein
LPAERFVYTSSASVYGMAERFPMLTDLGSVTISPAVMKLPFDVVKDFNGVTVLAYSPHMLAVAPDRPYKTVAEMIAYAKANPGKLNYLNPGNGSSTPSRRVTCPSSRRWPGPKTLNGCTVTAGRPSSSTTASTTPS